MYVAKLTIRQQRPCDIEFTTNAISRLLGSLYNNGQVIRADPPIAAIPIGYEVTLSLPEQSALEPAHWNRHVRHEWQRLQEVGLAEPEYSLAKDAEADACACEYLQSLILFTHFISTVSPLRCGDCFLPVPLYRVPPEPEADDYYSLRRWETDYQACDTLQMQCVTLERAAIRQMSRLDSSLSRAGLAVCRRIYEATQTPTYYYLYRAYTRSHRQERNRRCPSCGGEWRLEDNWHDLFAFKCDRCFLLSNYAMNLQKPY